VKGVFFIVGPTATGKSEIAADVARAIDAEVVSADAFQIYRGLDLLSAKPAATILAKASHHLIGTMSILQKMDAEKFRRMALQAIKKIHARDKLAIVVGGSGLYIKGVTHGLGRDWKEVDADLAGVFVFRERNELHERINQRVEKMFARGVIEEIRNIGEMSATASKMIGVREIREHLNGKMSILQCIALIQQSTRQYAKRQLTWFRHQTSFEPLNLTPLTRGEAVKWISQRAHHAFAAKG
jgi:tRNA A37 N6-isopentenylltransferase MiaA